MVTHRSVKPQSGTPAQVRVLPNPPIKPESAGLLDNKRIGAKAYSQEWPRSPAGGHVKKGARRMIMRVSLCNCIREPDVGSAFGFTERVRLHYMISPDCRDRATLHPVWQARLPIEAIATLDAMPPTVEKEQSK